MRVKIGKVGEKFFATPLPRGSGMISSLTRADGIVRIPALSEGLDENEETEVELLRPFQAILNTIVMVGSHDLTLDILANTLGRFYPPIFLSSHPVGSLGGILAIKNGICHMAGIHLLDPDTGEYNFPYIRQYLRGIDVKVIHLVNREQGLIVNRGNPKRIKGLEDLLRKDIYFINRQKGSGTRILLDHTLKVPFHCIGSDSRIRKGRIYPHGCGLYRCQWYGGCRPGNSFCCQGPGFGFHSHWQGTL